MNLKTTCLVIGLLLVICLPELQAASPGLPVLIDTKWVADFEKGNIGGWSSYPPFEDTAYDFTIFPGYYRPRYQLQGYVDSGELMYPVGLAPPAKPENNRYYLLRAYRPNSPSAQRIGFSHKLSLYLARNSEISFDYWLKLTASPADLLVELAGADGKRYSYRLTNALREQWQTVRIPVANFKQAGHRPPVNLEIQAVNIIAEIKRGDASTLHYFAIDNVRLTGKRLAGFRVQTPPTRTYPYWKLAFSQKHYHPGDPLDLKVVPEVESLIAVSARLEDIEGHSIVTGLSLSKHGKTWTGSGLYKFSGQDRRGPWTLILEGKTRNGFIARTSVRLWLLDRPQGEQHPRLFFTAADRQKLLDRTRTGRGKEIWHQVEKDAEKARNAIVPIEGQIDLFPEDYLLQQLRNYFAVLRTNARNTLLNALVYFVTGEQKAGNFARQTLITMAGWKQWVHPWFRTQGRKTYYPVGITALELGITYDLIYPLLTEEERSQVRRGVMKNGVINAFEEYFVDNRIPNHTSNWISHNTAGPLVAIMAFYSDFKDDEGKGNGEPYFSGLAEKFLAHTRATLKPDGGYGEGFGYQNFTMETAWPALAALKIVFGADLARSLYFDRAHLFPIYMSVHKGKELLDMGDSHDHRGASSNWAWLVQETRDPLQKWFYDQARGKSWEDFLWLNESIPATGPDSLPPGRVFPEKGNVVFRTGWKDDDVVLVYRAGANYNHTHADQGNFRLWAFGENLVDEAGPAHYYNDPYYWSYFIQSAGHNTILIDDNPESQEVGDFQNEVVAFRRHARLEDAFLSKPVSRVTSELGMLYRGQLEQFTRKILFIDPGYMVFYDRIRSRSGPHRYQWQLFPPQKEGLTISGNTAVYKGKKAWLQVNVISPSLPLLKMKDVPIPIHDYGRYPKEKLRPRAVLQVTHKNKLKNQDFIVALFPMKADSQKPERIEEVVGVGYKGARILFPDRQDEFLFATEGSITGKIATDGGSAFVRYMSDFWKSFSAEQATSFSLDGVSVLRANHPVDVTVVRRETGETWRLQAATATQVWIKQAKPGRLQINGNGRPLSVNDGLQGIDIRAGEVEVRIVYGSGETKK